MASIQKRGAYQWRVRIRKSGLFLTETFDTKSAAEQWASDTERQISEKTYIDRSCLKGKTLTDLLTCCEMPATKKKGAAQELAFIRRLKQTPLARKSLLGITSVDIREYRNWRLETVSHGTVIREMGMISSFYSYVTSEENEYQHLNNPVKSIRRPKAPPGRDRRILGNGYELEKIIEASHSETLKDFLPLAVETAMRRSELGNLCIEDVDLAKQTARLYEGHTKNGEGRTVPLSLRAVCILRKCIDGRTRGRIFDVAYDTISQAFARARNRARVIYEKECQSELKNADPRMFVGLVLHDMRHEGTSRFFEDKGLEMQEVAQITGHKDFRMLRRYTHLSASKLAKKLG